MSRSSQRNALLIHRYYSQFGTTQLKEMVKNRLKRARLGPKCPFWWPGGPWRARRTRFGHYCHWLLRLCWTHGYHTLWTNIGPLLYGMVCYLILLYGFTLNFISFYCIAMYCMTFHCIVSHGMVLYLFDIIAVYCMSPHCILWYGMVLYFIWSYCTVSHCYVPLLQRAGELLRSASSHFFTPLNLPFLVENSHSLSYFRPFLTCFCRLFCVSDTVMLTLGAFST